MPQQTTAPGGTRDVRGRRLLLRLGLPRDLRAPTYVGTFLVAALLTVLVTRAALAATGYPQLGGDGLHIAHVLWGGLLMAVALIVSTGFVGTAAQPIAALVGGVGFGLFVDEIGKFVTADNDYFYAPTAALVYVVLVVLALLAEVLLGRRRVDPSEALANAVAQAASGVAGGLTPAARERARRLLDQAGDLPGVAETRALLDEIETDHEELPDPGDAVRRWATRALHRVVRARYVPGAVVALFVAGTVATVAIGVLAAVRDAPAWLAAGTIASAATSFVLVGYGVWRLRRHAEHGWLWVRRAVLVGVLVTQVFLYRLGQWEATVGLVVDLFALAVVSVELANVRAGVGQAGEGADRERQDAAGGSSS